MKHEANSKLSLSIQNLLTEELECYRRIVELSEQQQRFIRLRDADALTSVLAQKEDQISKISHLENAIQYIFCRSPKLQQQMPESVNRLINTITDILGQLTVLEEESEAMVIERCNEMKRELSNLKQTKAILKIYAPQRTYRPRFIDTKT